MDQQLPYERIISGKLQSLPVPDLADAIWARVERQLDIDLPTDDGGSGFTPPAGPKAGPIGWGLSLFLLALVSVFLYQQKDQIKTAPKTNSSTPKVVAPLNTATGPKIENLRRGEPQRSSLPTTSKPLTPTDDSAAGSTITTVLPDAFDSVRATPPPLVVVPVVQDSVKKKRGVSGLTDGDYRIVPKKDNR